jgi:hypothetical protein
LSQIGGDPVELVGRTSASASGRALVPTVSALRCEPRSESTAAIRASVPFLAHLIATDLKAPQTRARRRAEPADAVAVYVEGGTTRTEIGQSFRRSM